jgi:hypothetical protein
MPLGCNRSQGKAKGGLGHYAPHNAEVVAGIWKVFYEEYNFQVVFFTKLRLSKHFSVSGIWVQPARCGRGWNASDCGSGLECPRLWQRVGMPQIVAAGWKAPDCGSGLESPRLWQRAGKPQIVAAGWNAPDCGSGLECPRLWREPNGQKCENPDRSRGFQSITPDILGLRRRNPCSER